MRGLIGRLKSYSLLGAIAVAAMPGVAHAVDIQNRDKVVRVLVVNEDNGEASVVTMPPKQNFANVCKSCVVLLGDMSVEAEGDATIVIERGKISLAKKK